MILLSFNRIEKIDNELLLLFCENEPFAVHLLIPSLDVMPIVLAVLDAVLLVPHLLISVVQLEPVLQPVVAVSLDDIGGRSGR